MDHKKHIAVVDDYASVRDAITSLLNSCGYAVDGFASSEEFLRFEGVADIACLVLDIGLPGINGLDLQRQLAGGWCPPIVFLTGKDDGDGRLRTSALATGAVGYLRKPFEAEELLDAVRRALSRRVVGLPRRA